MWGKLRTRGTAGLSYLHVKEMFCVSWHTIFNSACMMYNESDQQPSHIKGEYDGS